MMTRIEFHEVIKALKRRVAVLSLLWTPPSFAIIAFVGWRWRDQGAIRISLLVMGVALLTALHFRFLIGRWARKFDLICENCGKFCARSSTFETVLATGCCEHCGTRFLSDA
jgi:hypothetical protein